jgi:hypothetical protein
VEVLLEQGQDPVARRGHVQAEHVRPRHHHLPHERVLQLEHAVDHLALAAFDHALARADVHQGPELLLRHLGLAGLPLRPNQAQGEGSEAPEHVAKGCHQHRQPPHRPVDPRRESFRPLDGQGHGQDLAEHGQEEHHAADGDGEPDRTEEPLGDGGGQRGGADVGERDPHQQGHQQLVGLAEQRRQQARLFLMAFRELLEPGPPQGEIRGLRPGQQRRAQHEQDEPGDLGGKKARHRKCS